MVMSAFQPLRLADSVIAGLEYADLRKDTTYGDIESLCLEARAYGVKTVVVASALVARAVAAIEGEARVACPIAYPFGTQAVEVKVREAQAAIAAGAQELDIAPHFGSLRARRWEDVVEELETIARAARGVTLKLVLETGYLEDDVLERSCMAARDAGYSFVTNTIGFRIVSTQPETMGAASVEAVRRLARVAGQGLGVRAVGGARTPEDVAALRAAGASRVAVFAERGLLATWVKGGHA